MKVAIKTLGCKANRYESDKIVDSLSKIGITVVNENEKADYYLINTCTITHIADKKSRHPIRFFKKNNPKSKILVLGCGVRAKNNLYTDISEIDHIFKETDQLINFFKKIIRKEDNSFCAKPILQTQRTRALIKIQDGCNNFCSYCIVPYVRGREEFYSKKNILKDVKDKLNKGFKEIVITGIIVGNWKERDKDFSDLLHEILKEPKLERLRLSSLEPENFNNKFLKLFDNKKFCRHLHICLQSGSDTTLKNMRRRYDTKLFKNVCKKLKEICPEIAITTDIIVGFPNETNKNFEETVSFCKDMEFAKIHVFKYSKRDGTLASKMPQIPYPIKLERSKKLIKIANQLRKDFITKNLGKTFPVLFEQKKDNYYIGLTDNYIQVKTKSPKDLINQIKTVKLISINKNLSVNANLQT